MKKIIVIFLGVVLFLIITNPSMKRFREYNSSAVQKRVANYLIFSVYQTTDQVWNTEDHYLMGTRSEKYIGIAFNFFHWN